VLRQFFYPQIEPDSIKEHAVFSTSSVSLPYALGWPARSRAPSRRLFHGRLLFFLSESRPSLLNSPWQPVLACSF